jgi:hypothetical protein
MEEFAMRMTQVINVLVLQDGQASVVKVRKNIFYHFVIHKYI